MSDTPNSDLRAIFQGGGDAPPHVEPSSVNPQSRMPSAAPDLAQERADLANRLKTGKVATQDNRPLLDLAGIVGLGCVLLGLASMAFTTGVHPASLGLTGIGVLLLGIFTAMDWTRVKSMLSARSTVYSANLAITLGIFLAILVVVNMLANRYYYVIDMTAQQLNSLSPQSAQLLDDLRGSGREIAVTAFYPKDAENRDALRILEDTFALYRQRNPHIDFKIVDPDVNKALTEEKGITQNFTILFEAGENSTRITSFDEQSITGAFLKVTSPETKIVYFVVGHNEYRVTSDDEDGLSKLAEQLSLENLLVKELSIPSENGVPADAAAVVLVRPTVTPLQNQEVSALRDYVDRGGNLMVLLEPYQAPEMVAWLRDYGITMREDMVIDIDSNEFNEETAPILIPAENDHPLVPHTVMTRSGIEGLPSGVLTPSARSIETSNTSGVEWTPIFETSPVVSFGETDPNTEAPSYTEGTDAAGPLTVIAAGQKTGAETGGRLVVAGDAQWLTNSNLTKHFNRNMAVNSIAWLVGSDNQIAIRAREVDMTPVDLPGSARTLITTVSFGLPFLVAFAGVMVWWKRRTW